MKECSKCKQYRSYDEFYIRGDKKGCGYQSHCRVCVRSKRAEYVKKNPDKIKNLELKRSFGITLDQYNEMFANQRGCCSICNRHQKEYSKTFHADHCHATNRIRSLLCEHCNYGLGKFRDDPVVLQRAIDYLKKHSLGPEGNNIGLGNLPKKAGYLYS